MTSNRPIQGEALLQGIFLEALVTPVLNDLLN